MKITSIHIYRNKLLLIVPLLLLNVALARSQDKQAIISLKFDQKNDKKFITATASESINDSIGNPIPDLDLYFYVERSFSLLPIGDIFNTTDENGEVTVEFPGDLPGDTLGNVKIIVKIQDSDDYANTEVSKVMKWGIPIELDHSENRRTLWAASANAPIPLLILVNGLIAAAWGIIFYILFRIYKISRM